jgi:hypothetical protein
LGERTANVSCGRLTVNTPERAGELTATKLVEFLREVAGVKEAKKQVGTDRRRH